MKDREWLHRSREMEDPIDGFSNVWRAFNNLYFPVNGRNEREKIRSYIEGRFDEELAAKLIENHAGEVSYLLAEPVKDMRGNGRDTSHHIEGFQVREASLEKVKELFMIIYQIRCNLEHGQKSPFRVRDVELCRAARLLTDSVVDANA